MYRSENDLYKCNILRSHHTDHQILHTSHILNNLRNLEHNHLYLGDRPNKTSMFHHIYNKYLHQYYYKNLKLIRVEFLEIHKRSSLISILFLCNYESFLVWDNIVLKSEVASHLGFQSCYNYNSSINVFIICFLFFFGRSDS
eukprot:UN02275